MREDKIKKKLIFVSIISLIIFILILVNISYNGFLTKLDLSINYLDIVKSSFLINISKIIDLVFDTASIIIISLFLSFFLWFKYSKKEGIFFSLTILSSSLIIFVMKEIVQRDRPLDAIIPVTSFAFPSGHTATAVVFFGLLTYLILRKTKSKNLRLISIWISIFMIILIGFTRLYLNLHWFSDILGGLTIGAFVLISSILFKNILDEYKRFKV
ncbi:MAG: phosphatase PAP2 family protein [Candidatus Pacearchaeota archaeon]